MEAHSIGLKIDPSTGEIVIHKEGISTNQSSLNNQSGEI